MKNKIIVFDLDQTLGFFDQIVYIINQTRLERYAPLFELFPEIFRPQLFELLHSLALLKKNKRLKAIVLYTNNRNEDFVQQVIQYIHVKLGCSLFEPIITYHSAERTTKEKNYHDLFDCIKDGSTHLFCFVDDKYHEQMKHVNIYYIHSEAYQYVLDEKEVNARIQKVIPVFKAKKRNLPMNIHRRVTEYIASKLKEFMHRN
jgi:hypothetical protein